MGFSWLGPRIAASSPRRTTAGGTDRVAEIFFIRLAAAPDGCIPAESGSDFSPTSWPGKSCLINPCCRTEVRPTGPHALHPRQPKKRATRRFRGFLRGGLQLSLAFMWVDGVAGYQALPVERWSRRLYRNLPSWRRRLVLATARWWVDDLDEGCCGLEAGDDEPRHFLLASWCSLRVFEQDFLFSAAMEVARKDAVLQVGQAQVCRSGNTPSASPAEPGWLGGGAHAFDDGVLGRPARRMLEYRDIYIPRGGDEHHRLDAGVALDDLDRRVVGLRADHRGVVGPDRPDRCGGCRQPSKALPPA